MKIKMLVGICLLCLLTVVMDAFAAPVNELLPLNSSMSERNMLQFKAGGHVLGFQPNKAFLAGLDHVLSVEFLGTPGVMPTTDSPSVSATDNMTKAPALSTVRYQNLWDNISLTYESTKDGISESTYHVAPGGDVSKIRLRYNVPVEPQADGSLKFKFDNGNLIESPPVAWQEIGEKRLPVAVAFQVSGTEVGFSVGQYNHSYPLIIDPTLVWNTFYGSTNNDYGYSNIAVDDSGNVYVAGFSRAAWGSPLHPFSSNGTFDTFVLKLDSNGSYLWHTFYGAPSYDDMANGIAVDGNGNVYVTGYSYATWGSPLHFFSSSSGTFDTFVLKLDSSGAYQWHTFYGSSSSNDSGNRLAIDESGNIYVTGFSYATWGYPINSFSSNSGTIDIFVLKLDSSGAYQWHTFYGSPSNDSGSGIAVDSSGNTYITGPADASWGYPIHAFSGTSDIFVLKLDSSGIYQWHTFYGSSSTDSGSGIAVDSSRNIYVIGTCYASWGSPLHAYSGSGYTDACVLKLDSNGAYRWHTFYGSSSYDGGSGIAVDGGGNVYVTGDSYATWGSPLHSYSGINDALVLKLDSNGTYQWHAFYGSSSYDPGSGIAVDGSGNIYVTGYSFGTWGSPLHAYSGGSPDIMIFKMHDSSGDSVISVSPANQDVTRDGGTTTFTVSNTGTGTMPWTAEVTSGGSWLSITSGSSGSNAGTIGCFFVVNSGTEVRTGTIRVTANGATGSPVDVTVTQSPPPLVTITAHAEAGGTITPHGSVSVDYRTAQTFVIAPDTGYTVASVIVDGDSVTMAPEGDSFTFYDVKENHTISASFTSFPPHTIIVSAEPGGSISPSGGVSVVHGTNKTFTITPNTDYTVASVIVDGESVTMVPEGGSYTFPNVTKNHTIYASFRPTNNIPITIAQSYLEFSTIDSHFLPLTVTITAKDGNGKTLTGVNGILSISSQIPVKPTQVQFSGGTWTGDVTLLDEGCNLKLLASINGMSGSSEPFSTNCNLTGTIAGVVRDNRNNRVPGATVSLVVYSTEIGVVVTRQTDRNGEYNFQNVQAGWYTIWASMDGIDGTKFPKYIPSNRTIPFDMVVPVYESIKNPVILVPGFPASTDSILRGDFSPKLRLEYGTLDNLILFEYGDDPGWTKLKKYLHEQKGLEVNQTIIDCPWDWRVNIEDAVNKYLIPAIKKAQGGNPEKKVNIITHSTGALLVRYFIQNYNEWNIIDKFSMVGPPNKGVVETYYIWAGGDPLRVDNIKGEWTKLGLDNFYWRTIDDLWEETYNKGSLSSLETGRIRPFIREIVHSGVQLMPTFDFLNYNGELRHVGQTGFQENVNTFLIKLNSDNRRFERMGDRSSEGKVKTSVYFSSSENTIQEIPVVMNSDSFWTFRSSFYEDGRPKSGDPKMPPNVGDGTVLADSAKLPCDESWAESIEISGKHTKLITEYCERIANDLYTENIQNLSAKTGSASELNTTGTFSITLTGRSQAFLTSPSSHNTGVNPATGLLINEIPETEMTGDESATGFQISNPSDGTYSLRLSSRYNEDFTLNIEYLDDTNQNRKTYRGFIRAGSMTLNIVIDRSSENIIWLDHSPDSPLKAQANPVDSDGLKTCLSWQAVTGAQSYNIYMRYADEPYLKYVGNTTSTSFNSSYTWSDSNTILTAIAGISAVSADGKESMLSELITNDDRDHDGLTDVFESSIGTNMTNPDTDGDGLNDGHEYLYGTNPLKTDTDGDGYSDYVEVQSGSDPLDNVSFPPALSVTPTSRIVEAISGTTTFSVANIKDGIMNWTAQVTEGGSWLSITSGTSGTNSGTIICSFSENTVISKRIGTIRVSASGISDSSKDITITQEGIPVQTILSVNPKNQNVAETAGNTTFSVSNSGNGNMSWTAEVVSENDFLTIASGNSGVDSGTVICSFTANTVSTARTATIRITASGATGSPAEVTVTQDAATKHILSVSPDNQNVEYTAGTTGFTVSNTGTGTMNWESQVTSGSEWLKIQTGSSGTNSGAIQCAFSINPDPAERIGTIQVTAANATDSPKEITVTQAAAPKPVISVAPSNQSVSKDAGTTTFAVSNTGTGTMSWTASATSEGNWLSITSGDKGTNSGTIACAFTSNTNKTDRIGIIQVTAPDATGSPKVVTVTQEKGSPDPVISGLIETEAGKAISGVTITFSNDGGTATSDSTGNYNKTVDLGWSGTTTPTKSGYKFNPPFKEYSTVVIDQTEQDFIGQALPADQLLGAWQNGVWAWEKDSNKWTKLSSKTANALMIATGDVDGDKVDDLIGVWHSGLFVLQSTNGKWVKLSKDNPTWIAAGDLNNDGKADVIGSWTGDGTYFRDSSNGKWTKLSKPAKQIASGNIGGSRDDLVAVLSDGLWVRYSADASWLKLDSMIPYWTTAGDMNGDNRADIVVSKTDGTWYRNSDTGAWTKISTPAEQLAVGDIDGDGRDDLVGIWSNKLLIRYGANGQWQQLSTSKPKWITTGRVSEAMKASDAVEQQVAEKYIDLSAEGPGGKAFQSVTDHASGTVMTE